MKKKLFVGLAAAALAGVMSLGLAACNVSTGAKSVTGEKVTEKQWITAFKEFSSDKAQMTVEAYTTATVNYTHKTMVHTTEWSSNISADLTLVKNGKLEMAVGNYEIELSGDKAAAEKVVGKEQDKEVKKYSEISKDTIYNYEKGIDGFWTKEEASSSVFTGSFKYAFGDIMDNYDKYLYSVEHSGYVSKTYKEGDSNVTVYKFKDAKLVAIYIYFETTNITDEVQEYERSTIKREESYTISYSAEEITLPQPADKS